MLGKRIIAQSAKLGKLQGGALARQFSSTTRQHADFTHAVIGAGAVGLAIARRLQQHGNGVSTVLIEKHGAVGTETSSRNSEVSIQHKDMGTPYSLVHHLRFTYEHMSRSC